MEYDHRHGWWKNIVISLGTCINLLDRQDVLEILHVVTGQPEYVFPKNALMWRAPTKIIIIIN